MYKVYHTQEDRQTKLEFPIKCERHDAWLGDAYYFWEDSEDAYSWGNQSKKRTGYFDMYKCDLDTDNVLDTVFVEEHYHFWYNQLEKIAKKILVKTGEKPTLKELNDYIVQKEVWKNVDLIRFQDLPVSSEKTLVKPISYKDGKIRKIAFRKRIQYAVYNKEIIINFAHFSNYKVV